ncbi:MAG: DUF1631 domain-containing protein [Gammaproteobacteria bacterium]|nr:DUF1631 domain-containing protein [Gammaproteobacteria bacterium]
MTELGNHGPAAAGTAASGTLSDAVVIQHLKACQATLVEHARNRFAVFSREFGTQLVERTGAAKTNQEQAELTEQQRILKQSIAEIERYFLGYLGEGFIKFKRRELATSTGEEKFQGDMLALVDNEDLEETIAISSITHRAENHYAETLWALNQRFSVLNGGQKVHDRGNPAGPIQFCESLRKAFKRAPLTTKVKIIAFKVFDREMVSQLADALEDVNEYLRAQGILPDLRYRPATNEAPPVADVEEASYEDWDAVTAGQDSAVDLQGFGQQMARPGYMAGPDTNLPPDQYQGRLVDAIRTLQNHISSYVPAAYSNPVGAGAATGYAPAAAPGYAPGQGGNYAPNPAGATPAPRGDAAVPGGRPAMIYTNQQLVGAVQNLQVQARAVTGQKLLDSTPGNLEPMSISDFGNRLAMQLQQEAEDEDRAVDPGDLHTIELVGMLFEYMLSDDNLPDSVKALLSYLHTPFLKVAFIDKDFFEQTEHPARLLLNTMAEAGVKWVSNDGTSQYDIYDKIKVIISRVLEEFESDVRLFAELLLEFSGYTKSITRRQELMERRAMEKVQGEEKLREVKLRVNREVRDRTDGRELPSAVLLMLLQPWSDYLAFILLRYGEKSESWQRATQVIDDVLWSIEPKETNADKNRQMEMHDSLIDILETGFETIGYDQSKGKKLLEALYSLQKMALQSKQVEPAPEPMRNKLEALADAKAGKTESDNEVPTAEEREMVENLKMIEFGTWLEFEGGKRLKVAWYNSKTLHYMLVDQMGKKVAMKSGLELARDMLWKKARVIAGSSKPFFERALENIFHKLNAKAEDLKEETGDE